MLSLKLIIRQQHPVIVQIFQNQNYQGGGLYRKHLAILLLNQAIYWHEGIIYSHRLAIWKGSHFSKGRGLSVFKLKLIFIFLNTDKFFLFDFPWGFLKEIFREIICILLPNDCFLERRKRDSLFTEWVFYIFLILKYFSSILFL